jgi:lipoyl synthase
MRSRELFTVCEEARCPNRGECFARGTATFLLMGDVCTRACGFCDIKNGRPAPIDPGEPDRVVSAVREMSLRYVVLTSVNRDDRPDGGAAHFASVVRALRRENREIGLEVLTPDFRGRRESVQEIVEAGPDVYNHNVETVGRLYGRVRPGARLDRSLHLLAAVKEMAPEMTTKSGLMVGLGESEAEVRELLVSLRQSRVDIVTIGQYLAPSRGALPIVEYVSPRQFEQYRLAGEALGFRHVFSGPFVRSSYRAEEALQEARRTGR